MTRKPLALLSVLLAAGLTAQDAMPSRHEPMADRHDAEGRENRNGRGRKLKHQERVDLREAWNEYWFGGKPDPEFLRHKAKVAGEEAERWEHLLPIPGRELPLAPDGTGTWMNLGPKADVNSSSAPDIDSGRLAAIVPHPTNSQILYVATSGGGVFRCDNADLAASGDWTWTPITDNLPSSSSGGNVSVGGFAVNPAAPDTLYLGAGDAFDAEAVGFFRSVNGGASWTAATGMGNQTRTYDILALNGTVVLVGTNDGLKRSTDGGQTFSAVSLGGSTTGMVWSVQRLSTTDLVCTRQTSAGTGSIWYSRDSGATWTQATLDSTVTALSPRRITVATSANSATTVWGICQSGSVVARGLLRSTDRGQTWTFVAAPTATGGLFQGIGNQMDGDGTQASYNQLLAVDPTNANRVFVGTNLALYRTENGGASWVQLTHWYAHRHVYAHADFHTAAWSPAGNTLYFGNDGGLGILRQPAISSALIPTGTGMVASDTSFIDNRRNKGLATHLVYSLGSTSATSPSDASSRVTLGLQDNGTRVRLDAGAGLQASSLFEDRIGGDGFGTLIHPTNGNLMLGSLYFSNVQRSADGGATDFTDSFTGITEANSETAAPFATMLTQGNPADTVYTFVNTKVYRSTNFGTSWAAMGMSGFSTSRTIRNVAASASNANAVAVVTTGATGYVTTNGGGSWVQFGALPNFGSYEGTSNVWFDTTNSQVMYVTSVAPSPGASHVWRSANGGSTWTAIDRNGSGGSNGFPFGIPVHVIKNDPASSTTLFAGTDFGVYRSTDSGATWARYGQGMPLVATRDLYVSPGGTFVRAGTFGRGVWELTGGTPPPPPTTFLEVEPNSTIAGANVVANTYTAIQGNPTSASDPDYFALTLAPGQGISIAMTGPVATGLDWDLYIRNAAGTALSTSEGGSTTENVSYTNTTSSPMTVYAHVVDYQGTSSTPYNLALTYTAAPVDNTAPTVTASESGTSGTITLSATASDNAGGSGMAKVEFYVDGVLKGTDTTSPYSMTLNSTTLTEGSHSLVAKATDVAGNAANSNPVAFTISNGGQNEVESNNSTSTANTVSTSGTTVTGYISSTTDTDYFKVTLAPGRTLTATLTPPGSSDFDLYIYNSTSTTPIASSENGTGLVDTASVTNTGTTSITRYIQVKYYLGASTTTPYKLKLDF